MKNFRQQHRPKKSSLVIGRNAVIEVLRTGQQLDRIYLDTRATGEEISEIKRLAVQNGVPVNYVPAAKLNSFNVTNHDGCVAQIAKVQYQNLQDVISLIIDNGEAPLLLILDGITDIRNIGGIARTALCCGVHAIIIPDKGVGALNEDAILTSAGALEQIAVCRVNSLMKAVDELHLNGIKVFASEMTAEKNVADCDYKTPCAIVMGSEEKGIYPALMKICDEKIKIPMARDFESLNVSVATGIILYEVMKQRLF
ncbi:MAG: 23S rRNA (guanosine(2251)-2'-O)-methyltransferase RlmB [Chitinophagaceae bacterium]|nr:23S rRNA (guanosine(2251)-2'-O)-methyltransferase RlmB [Chitinophagaceae bacterium]MBL0306941.1 23S rRNA (guanosine(2251)-2'-O)-methyltransferase RlmB [Chitinophagaceae bacterium]MBP6215028.1 23S rRNA (guanosine(2251)-2'-O)-methyltransferase RlmB [Chitinophagaceae bacterium]HQV60496.1 23S rRNA (guanosine(2251)-2'-O)-methyltransferase RlmB [Chitinophagaceae bacterium]HQV85054.1 23S rRNA (guanosine(2251)-2'-O)-methyltransferase RlmB [Chitinophagaceae bacterium]